MANGITIPITSGIRADVGPWFLDRRLGNDILQFWCKTLSRMHIYGCSIVQLEPGDALGKWHHFPNIDH